MTHSISFAHTSFLLGLGSRGARAELPGTVTLDATKVTAEINAFIYGYGADILLRQASNVAEKEQQDEWQKAHPKMDLPPIAKFPFDLDRLRSTALKAMEERVQAWYRGDLGRDGMPMNAIDRRAATLIQAGLAAGYAKKGLKAPEDWSPLVAQVLADPEKGKKYRAIAQAQFEAERKAAAEVGDDLLDAVAPPKAPAKPGKAA